MTLFYHAVFSRIVVGVLFTQIRILVDYSTYFILESLTAYSTL
jgi:hypothetical protein